MKIKSTLKWIFASVMLAFFAMLLIINFAFPIKYNCEINKFSKMFDLEPSLLRGVIWTESRYNTKAVSPAGAIGLMQLMPETAKWCAFSLNIEYNKEFLLNPEYNIRLGAFYLSHLSKKYGKRDALICYNAGEGNYLKWDGSIEFKETRDYIKKVAFAKNMYKFIV